MSAGVESDVLLFIVLFPRAVSRLFICIMFANLEICRQDDVVGDYAKLGHSARTEN